MTPASFAIARQTASSATISTRRPTSDTSATASGTFQTGYGLPMVHSRHSHNDFCRIRKMESLAGALRLGWKWRVPPRPLHRRQARHIDSWIGLCIKSPANHPRQGRTVFIHQGLAENLQAPVKRLSDFLHLLGNPKVANAHFATGTDPYPDKNGQKWPDRDLPRRKFWPGRAARGTGRVWSMTISKRPLTVSGTP